MKVENKRAALAIDRTQAVTTEPVREETEITATGDGQCVARQFQRAQGEFRKLIPFIGGEPVGPSGGSWHAIAIMANGEYRGIPGETLFGQDIQCPAGLIGD